MGCVIVALPAEPPVNLPQAMKQVSCEVCCKLLILVGPVVFMACHTQSSPPASICVLKFLGCLAKVIFWPSESDLQSGDGEFDGIPRAQEVFQALRNEDALVEEVQYEDSSSGHGRLSLWSRIAFFALLFGSILTLIISVRQVMCPASTLAKMHLCLCI